MLDYSVTLTFVSLNFVTLTTVKYQWQLMNNKNNGFISSFLKGFVILRPVSMTYTNIIVYLLVANKVTLLL